MQLPVNEILPQLLDHLRSESNLVLKAPPGAGKTTLVPLAIMREFEEAGRVFLTQPRRLAARSCAARIAELHGSAVGESIGYQVRLERRWRASTRLVAMTTGVLLRRLINDPFLEGTGTVVLDEFHERTLELDLVLGLLLRLQQTVRPELRIVVMSATIDCGPVAEFLGNDGRPATTMESPGRVFDVLVRYHKPALRQPIEETVAAVLPLALSATPGHLLVFLPGVGEIMRTERAIATIATKNACDVMPLFGEMPPDEQDRVLQPAPKRKIVLATNVAETSLTIDGVTGVIDSGLVRTMRFDSHVGLSKLELESNSRASADQRSGRAGRQSPGVAFRLWPENTHRSRPEFDTPEIHRGDLAGALLQLIGMGENDFEAFPWLTPPRPAALSNAIQTLLALEAIEELPRGYALTRLGQQMLKLPLTPRLARLLLASVEQGIAQQGALAAALLSERDPFRVSRGAIGSGRFRPNDRAVVRSQSDLVDRVERLERFLSGADDPTINVGAVKQVVRVANDILRSVQSRDEDDAGAEESSNESNWISREQDTRLRYAIWPAYADRLARRRAPGSDRGLMVGNIGVRLGRDSNVSDAEYFVCVDIEQRDRDAEVRVASSVDADWIEQHELREADEYFFHPTQKTVQARRRRYWMDLMLDEMPIAASDSVQVETILFEQVLASWNQVFPKDDVAVGTFIRRIECSQFVPRCRASGGRRSRITRDCQTTCAWTTKFDEVRSAPWADYLTEVLTYEQQQQLSRLVPLQWVAPSGRGVDLQYEVGKSPRFPFGCRSCLA
ncbi:MAG: helicase-related protein [Pirellulaceae bacterium]